MKKILFAIGSLSGGGGERVVSVWAGQLAERGYDTAVFTYAKADDEYYLSPKVKRLTLVDDIKDYLSQSGLKRYRNIRKIIKGFSPDVVISFFPTIQIWMKAATIGLGVKRIDTVRVNPLYASNSKAVNAMWRWCLKTSALTILQCEDQKMFFNKKIQKKCAVVPNPLSEVYENCGKDRYSNENLKFIAAGRLCKQKNFPMLIKAFAKAHAQNPKITLDIYGEGTSSYIEFLDSIINQDSATEYIHLCGRTSDMHGELLNHDAFVMSSDYEGMPNALAEAMATGLVCISTDCPTGPRDLIRGGENGFLVPVDDVDAMAEKIIEVSNMSATEIESLGKSARKFVVDYCGRENSLAKLIDAIEKC